MLFVSCVVYGLVVPAAWHRTPTGFVLGLVESVIQGVYAGLVFTPIYNFVALRAGTAGVSAFVELAGKPDDMNQAPAYGLWTPAFDKSARLPEGQTVPVEFLPRESGEYEFACQMGMFRGTLIVE